MLSERPVVHINEDDIIASRIKSNTIFVDELQDLDQTSKTVIEIYEKISGLEKGGQELLSGLKETDICTIKISFRIKILIRNAREEIDICVREDLNKTDILKLNVSEFSKLLRRRHSFLG